jgi:hypothetical protein
MRVIHGVKQKGTHKLFRAKLLDETVRFAAGINASLFCVLYQPN